MVMAGWSVHLPHFFLVKLEQADNKYFPHILSLVLQAKVKSVTDNNPSQGYRLTFFGQEQAGPLKQMIRGPAKN